MVLYHNRIERHVTRFMIVSTRVMPPSPHFNGSIQVIMFYKSPLHIFFKYPSLPYHFPLSLALSCFARIYTTTIPAVSQPCYQEVELFQAGFTMEL